MSDAGRPTVLIVQPMMAPLQPALEALGCRVLLGREAPAEDRGRVRAVLQYGPAEREWLEFMPQLGLIALITAGYDGIDLDWCQARGIRVTHARGVNADDVADHALGLILAGWRGIAAADQYVKTGGAERPAAGRSLTGRQAGILGLGHIGAAVGRRVEALGMKVAWWGPNSKPVAWPRAESVLALAEASDILVVASSANDANRGVISREVIEAVGPQGMIVNVARGQLVDEDALIAALKTGRLGRAGLDVFVEEPPSAARWTGVPNVVLTPHMGGGTVDTVPRMTAAAVEQIRLFLAGEPLTAEVPR